MLILTRKFQQSIMLGDDIKITVVETRNGQVRLGIEAPKDLPVHREEIYHRLKREEKAKK